jgi:serine/threonine protein kinase
MKTVKRGLAVDAPTPAGPAPRGARRQLVGHVIDGKYHVRRVLGEGGMGTVYEAEHAAINRLVALKVIHPAQATKTVAVKRFQREARAAGAIGHPNICEVLDFGTLSDGGPYLVMEKLEGSTLAQRIALEGALPVGEVLDAMTQILSGLDAAHSRGILHRDIKPENVFLCARKGHAPLAKLLDFGVSKVISARFNSEEEISDLTKEGTVMGTPFYMSPEQARGERDLDVRVDVYACGVMLYEALTGQRPYFSQTYNVLLAMILDGNAASPRELRPSLSVELERVVMTAMARDRGDRYPSVFELSRALGAILKPKRTSARIRASARVPADTPEIPIHFEDNVPTGKRRNEDVPTNRMHKDQIKALTDAIREARARESKPR